MSLDKNCESALKKVVLLKFSYILEPILILLADEDEGHLHLFNHIFTYNLK